MAQQPASTDPNAGSATSAGDEPTLLGVVVNQTRERSRVVLMGNILLPYTSFVSQNPPAVILDLNAQISPNALGRTEVKSGVLKEIQVSSYQNRPNLQRVSLNLSAAAEYQVTRDGNNLIVTIQNTPQAAAATPQPAPKEDEAAAGERFSAAPASAGASRITGLDFTPLEKGGGSRLTVTATGPVQPRIVTENRGRTIVLSVSPASIGDLLRRHLDTRYFESAVDTIKPAQIGPQTVNLTISLREAVPYHLAQEGNQTYLDFDPSTKPAKPLALPQPQKTAAMTGPAPASTTAPASATTAMPAGAAGGDVQYSGPRLSLDFQNADIHHVLRLIGEVASKNVVISDRVKGLVTLRLKEVPWEQALNIVLLSQDLGVKVDGNVLRIETLAHLDEEKKRQLDHLISERKIRQEAQQLDTEEKEILVRRIWTPKYAPVDTMLALLTPLKSQRGSIKLIGNDIFIEEREDVARLMEAVLQKNDTVTKQILIEARIVEAQTNFTKNIGVNWGGRWEDKNKNLGGLLNPDALSGTLAFEGLSGASRTAVNLISPPSVGLSLGMFFQTAALDLNAQLYAMEQTGEGRIVSAPRILANNDQEVYIKQGQSIPYETLGTLTEPSKIDYKEAELKLAVTPHIEENGEIITMAIKVTKDTPDFSLSTRNPPINTREAQTKLMVRDGETVVIGGIIIDEKSNATNRIPAMHKIPILGWLFKNYSVQDSKTELLIFITAHIIPVKI
jgi:type IV pilus assembly protein PilQ